MSAAFALVLFAQVGFIVHLISFLDSVIGRQQAAIAVALLTAMAVVGRVLFSFVIDRMNQRLASSLSFVSQAIALLVIINIHHDYALIAACALFGFSVGNLITLPALIVQREFDPRSFGVLVSLITAINQITYAFGPGAVGLLRDISGSYTLPFYGCIAVELTAAVLIMIRGRGGAGASPGSTNGVSKEADRGLRRRRQTRRSSPSAFNPPPLAARVSPPGGTRIPAAAANPPDPAFS